MRIGLCGPLPSTKPPRVKNRARLGPVLRQWVHEPGRSPPLRGFAVAPQIPARGAPPLAGAEQRADGLELRVQCGEGPPTLPSLLGNPRSQLAQHPSQRGTPVPRAQYPLGTHFRWTHLDAGGLLRGASQREAAKPLGLLRILSPLRLPVSPLVHRRLHTLQHHFPHCASAAHVVPTWYPFHQGHALAHGGLRPRDARQAPLSTAPDGEGLHWRSTASTGEPLRTSRAPAWGARP